MEEEASGKVELRAGQALWMTRNDHLAAQELAAVFGERPGQLLNMPTGDGPGDDQPLDFRRALEDRVGAFGRLVRFRIVQLTLASSVRRAGP